MRIEVLPHAGHVRNPRDELQEMIIVVRKIDFGGIDDQQRRIVIEMKKARIGVNERVKIVAADVLFRRVSPRRRTRSINMFGGACRYMTRSGVGVLMASLL